MFSNLIYRYNDSVYSMLYHYASYEGKSELDFFRGNRITFVDSFTEYIYQLLDGIIHPIFFNNLIILFTIFLLVFFSYLLFLKFLKINNILALLFSIILVVSPYFIYRIISYTTGLYLIFFPFLIALLLLKEIKPLLVGIVTFFILSFSNYYGFFCFILVVFWYLFDLISIRINFKQFAKKILLFFAPVLIGIVILFFPLLKSNLTFSKDYTKESNDKSSNEKTVVYRPIEDWYNLSFRPWYFFIPPKFSVFFGEFSKNIHEKIKNTGYYLADDYMEEEMAGSYMGWHFLLGLGTVVVILLLKKYKNVEFKTFKTVYGNKEMIIRSFFIIFCILLISGPPSFTIGGVEIYTPTYLLYYIVPVFRTLVRWAVVIYLFVLIINSFLVQDLYNLMKTKLQKILFIIAFLTLNFVIFAIKIPVININKPPEEIAFVKERYPGSVPYAVYPKGDYYSIFWIISHEDLLINPVNFVNYETGFDSNEFSKRLITEDGIKEFLKLSPKYLIYYPNNISGDDLEKITKINPTLKTKEDIYEFFKSKFGDGLIVGESVVFNINN